MVRPECNATGTLSLRGDSNTTVNQCQQEIIDFL